MKHGETLDQFLRRASDTLFPDQDHAPEPMTVHCKASDGDTPLHVATLWGDRHAARMLLDAGADVNAKGDMSCSPLYFAVMSRHVQIAELLLECGADPDGENELNSTPRNLATRNGDKAMMALFRGRKKF